MTNVLITGARAPVALHLTRCLAAAGCRVILADSLAFPLARASRFSSTYVRLPPPRGHLRAFGEAVRKTCHIHGIDMILPTCEEVFHLAAARDLLDLELPLFAPPFAKLAQVHDKYGFSRMAMGLGADPAETHLLTSPADAEPFADGRGWVFKPVWSRFGDRALIQPNDLSDLHPTESDPWVAQRYLLGEELCAYAVAHEGKLCALTAYRPLYRAGNGIGAGVMIEPVDDPAIAAFTAGIVRRTGWHGQISFDFRRDQDGALHVLECNPRATTGAHLFNVADRLGHAILSGDQAEASGQKPLGVPLAMWLYGLPPAMRNGHLKEWRRDLKRMDHLLESPSDRSTLPWQWLALGEAVTRAIAGGQGLKAAATADIEWNGEPLS